MKQIVALLLLITSVISCVEPEKSSEMHTENWSKRSVEIPKKDSLEVGKSYLSIYSQIYSLSEKRTHNLTVMVSLRNTSDSDTIYVSKANHYDTHGESIREYIKSPIYLAPMETAEIIIDEKDTSGGTGGNFIFEWYTPKDVAEPLFEGLMSSTMGKQGLSFITQAIRIK